MATPAAWATDGGAHVDLEEHPLDGHHLGPVLGEQRPQVGLEGGQPVGHVERRVGAQDAGGHGPGPAAGALDHAVAAARQTRVDAEHEHGFGP